MTKQTTIVVIGSLGLRARVLILCVMFVVSLSDQNLRCLSEESMDP